MYEEFSAVYEAKIREDFNYPEMARFIEKQLRRSNLSVWSALDMGGGTGNASLELLPNFQELILCDPSAEMLTVAADKFSGPRRPHLIQAQASDFLMTEYFDLIYSVLDVPNYMTATQLAEYFQKSFQNLKETGLFIFDLSTPHKLQAMAQTGVFVYDDEDYFHVWENRLVDGHLELTLNAFVKAAGQNKRTFYERITEEQIMYLHPVSSLEAMARKAGFRLVGTYDGYREQPAQDGSDRVVFVLKKEKDQNG